MYTITNITHLNVVVKPSNRSGSAGVNYKIVQVLANMFWICKNLNSAREELCLIEMTLEMTE